MAAAPVPAEDITALSPFLLIRPSLSGVDFKEVLSVAAAGEARAEAGRCSERCRIVRLLCEVALVLNRKGVSFYPGLELPIARGDLADLLGASLVRVKRALGHLALTRVIETDAHMIRVLDWPRLCALAKFDPALLDWAPAEDDDILLAISGEEPPKPVTAAGDPACFV